MTYFITGKFFLTPSFDIEVKEQEKITNFLRFLDSSGVGTIISKYEKNTTSKGGRPNCNYYKLFATILYGFAFKCSTLRELEEACKFDLRFITIMEQTKVDYTTICKFINKVIVPNEKEIFMLINKQIKKEININFEDAFIDGTKFEANANKYKFVWKPITFHKRISIKINEIITMYNLYENYKCKELISSKIIANAMTNLSLKKGELLEETFKNINLVLSSMLQKVLEYEEKERICGPNRNSYYKTDHDATAMCLKEDYYSGLGSNMHAAYNAQILVIKGFVFSYYVSQSRNDMNDFTATLDYFYELYGEYPKNVCADSGYGSLKNYEYLKNNSIGNYVKYQTWEGNVTGRNPDCYVLNEDDTITCLNNLKGYETSLENRHPRKSNAVFYIVEGCQNCNFSPYCKKFMKIQNEDFKIFEIVKPLQRYKQEAAQNLLSTKGIEIRVNRSIQVEGVFGVQKQNYKNDRFRRRTLTKVSAEAMLNFLGFNIAKLFRYYENLTLNDYWIAPVDLTPQTFKKPSWKRLAKKGKRVNQNTYKNETNKK